MAGTNNLINTHLPLTVASGGTGNTATALTYGIQCGGTSSTSAIQSIGSLGTSGQVLQSMGSGALPEFVTASAFAGSILQAQQFVLTTQVTLSSTSTFESVGLQVNITPLYSTSKILILSTSSACNWPQSTHPFSGITCAKLLRNTTGIGLNTDAVVINSTAAAGNNASNTAHVYPANISIAVLDSPATTSTITYSIKYYSTDYTGTSGLNLFINTDSDLSGIIAGTSIIIALEISG